MYTTIGLIDDIARKFLCNDSEVSRKLGLGRSAVNSIRKHGTVFEESTALRAADLLGLPRNEVALDIQVERSKKNPESAAVWETIRNSFKSAAATLCAFVVAGSLALPSPRVDAAGFNIMKITSNNSGGFSLPAQRTQHTLCTRRRRSWFARFLGTFFPYPLPGFWSTLIPMGKARTLLFSIFCMCAPAHAAASDWTDDDTRRQAMYYLFHVIDWGQTRYIAEHPGQYSEANPLVNFSRDPGSEHENRRQADKYFLVVGIAHYGIARILPPEHRRIFQNVTIAFAAGSAAYNYSIGIKAHF